MAVMIPDPSSRVGRRLLDDVALEASSVVANNAMNRERGLSGANSYAKELGFDPYVLLISRVGADADRPDGAAWLDLCCGSGRALIHAAGRFAAEHPDADIAIVGVDLVDYFAMATRAAGLEFIAASVARWEPHRRFDLVTCVHGLHYVGDKLGLLARAASWLTSDGLLVADFDANSIRSADGRAATREVAAALKSSGVDYDPRRRRVTCRGRRTLHVPATYLGADDVAGPGYTGQPAVDSYYAWP